MAGSREGSRPRCHDRGGETRVHEARPAVHVDLAGGAGVDAGEGRAAVAGGGLENVHGAPEAGVAVRLAAAHEGVVQREVVDVRVGGRVAGDGVGEAVGGGGGVAQTRSRVERAVGEEPQVRLLDDGVLRGEVGGARRVRGDVGREGGHQARAGGDVGGAGEVEGLGDADEGFLDLEERVGVLRGVRSGYGGVDGREVRTWSKREKGKHALKVALASMLVMKDWQLDVMFPLNPRSKGEGRSVETA